MARARVLIANEPPAYREVLALALQEMRVPADVTCVEPEDLDSEIVRLAPHLVICSRLTKDNAPEKKGRLRCEHERPWLVPGGAREYTEPILLGEGRTVMNSPLTRRHIGSSIRRDAYG